jgi:hypothetical protein
MAIEIRPLTWTTRLRPGRAHVRAWQAAYTGGLMPEGYLDSLSEADRASMWRSSLENAPWPRAIRLVATVDHEVVGFALVGSAGGDQPGHRRVVRDQRRPDPLGHRSRRGADECCHGRIAGGRICVDRSLGSSEECTSALVLHQAWMDQRRRRTPARSVGCRSPRGPPFSRVFGLSARARAKRTSEVANGNRRRSRPARGRSVPAGRPTRYRDHRR